MEDGAKFCPSCGTVAGGAASAPRPKAVTVGQVKKCPSCGSPVESFQTRCEICGVELNNTEISSNITDFIEQINKLDEEIVLEKEKINLKKGIKFLFWVILNIFTCCIPLFVRSIKRVVFPPVPHLTPWEQRKKSYIENFVVPTNREDIMEFILFASTKVASMMDHTGRSIKDVGVATMWGKIWSDKCRQVNARAGVALANEQKTLEIINSFDDKSRQLMEKVRRLELVKTAAVAAFLIAPLPSGR
jgi:hypothetical protein